jgi:hypothetical protein
MFANVVDECLDSFAFTFSFDLEDVRTDVSYKTVDLVPLSDLPNGVPKKYALDDTANLNVKPLAHRYRTMTPIHRHSIRPSSSVLACLLWNLVQQRLPVHRAFVLLVVLNLVFGLFNGAMAAAADTIVDGSRDHAYDASVLFVVLLVPGDVVADFELLCHALTFPAGT